MHCSAPYFNLYLMGQVPASLICNQADFSLITMAMEVTIMMAMIVRTGSCMDTIICQKSLQGLP